MAMLTTDSTARRIIAVYPYHDEGGTLLYEVVRFEPKSFAQRLPDGTWGLSGRRRVLYRIPELLAAPPDARIVICEGEKDCDRLCSHGLTATTSGAAGSWRPEFAEWLKGRNVVVLADNDARGLVHADDVARSLFPVAASVRVVWLPGLPEHGDVSDWLDTEHTVSNLCSIIEQTPTYEAPEPGAANEKVFEFPPGGTVKSTRKSQASRLVEVLPDDAALFHTASGEEYASLSIDGHRETHRIKSATFRQHLRRLFYQQEEKAPSTSAVHDAVELIAARARFDRHEEDVFLRTAPGVGGFWLDLCDGEWRAIEITASDWRVVQNPPVRFRRAPGMLALPEPQRGGSLDELDEFLNLKSDDDRVLLGTLLTAAMRSSGPYVVACIHGEHGTAKSTTTKVIKSLVDPSAVPLSAAPRDERDLLIAASNSWLLSFDNLSRLDGWLSDAICRLATGGGLRTRTLYSDGEETIFDAQRPIILNGIESLAARGDLVDRAITIYLSPIAPERRREESEFWAAFRAARPRIVGALLDAMVGGLAQQQAGVRLDRRPRMADFATWGAAMEQPLGFSQGTFISAYEANRTDSNAAVLESSPVAAAIMAFMNTSTTWSGTAGELLDKVMLLAGAATKGKSWPGSPRSLSGILRRLAPNLREAGIEITFTREGHARRRVIEISRRGAAPNTVRTVHMSPGPSVSANEVPQPIETSSATPSAVGDSRRVSADGADDADGQKPTSSARPPERKVRAEL